MATKQQQAAAAADKPLSLAEQALQHSVYFNASTCEIKGDVVQLAAVWVSLCLQQHMSDDTVHIML
jgi:hypothetical protein